jgi:SAM-dependent methyltransferase
MTEPVAVNLWTSAGHALEYLERADSVPHRTEGERTILEILSQPVERVLDLGTGDGRLLALVKLAHPGVTAVALDFSDTMLERARQRFAGDTSVTVIRHDLDDPLPALGSFDAVVSSFAIHHVPHARKRALYAEIFALLADGGAFCNLEHVASPTEALHDAFLATLGITRAQEDASNKLLDVETQLTWLREIGFADVECYWKWRELAVLAGTKNE